MEKKDVDSTLAAQPQEAAHWQYVHIRHAILFFFFVLGGFMGTDFTTSLYLNNSVEKDTVLEQDI